MVWPLGVEKLKSCALAVVATHVMIATATKIVLNLFNMFLLAWANRLRMLDAARGDKGFTAFDSIFILHLTLKSSS